MTEGSEHNEEYFTGGFFQEMSRYFRADTFFLGFRYIVCEMICFDGRKTEFSTYLSNERQ